MMTKQYDFLKNIRIVSIVLGAAYLVFMAGAAFTGYSLNLVHYLVLIVIVVNLVNAVLNKPTPPPPAL
jgi:hypothetical protein